MATFRVFFDCNGNNIWTTFHKNGTLWHGSASFYLNALRDKLPPIEIIDQHSERNYTLGVFQDMYEGKLDFSPSYTNQLLFGKFIEQTFALHRTTYNIVSAKKVEMDAKVLEGIFDLKSYYLFCLIIFLLAILCTVKYHDRGQNIALAFVNYVLIIFGNLLAQSNSLNNGKGKTYKRINWLVRMSSRFFVFFYFAVITSKLIAKKHGKPINTLEDLAKSNIKIYARDRL